MSAIKLDEKDIVYLTAYMLHTARLERGEHQDVRFKAWQSKTCAECGSPAENANLYPHIVDAEGFVLICCEGYHQINPAMIGMDLGNWQDWHEEIGGLEPEMPEELRHLEVECIRCGTKLGVCQAAGKPCCEICIHAEGP